MVGPVPTGVNKFVFQAPAPAKESLPVNEVLGVTVVLLTCSYFGREFVRVGYYLNNSYQSDENEHVQEVDEKVSEQVVVVEWDKLHRSILSDKPRVTRFPIAWTRQEPELEVVEACDDSELVDDEMQQDEEDEDEDSDAGMEADSIVV